MTAMLRWSRHLSNLANLGCSAAVRAWGDPLASKMAGLEGALVGAGNPLLDISAVVTKELLDKYGVRSSAAI